MGNIAANEKLERNTTVIKREDDLILSDGAAFAHALPHELWKTLRDEDPVHLTASKVDRDYWSITRHADVQTVLSNAALFSSRGSGVSLPTSRASADPRLSEHARLSQAGAMLPVLDQPRHGAVRRPFIQRFAPKIIDALEPRVRAQVAGAVRAAGLEHRAQHAVRARQRSDLGRPPGRDAGG